MAVKPEIEASAKSEEHGLSQKAIEIARPFGFPITNSMLVTWIGSGPTPTSMETPPGRKPLSHSEKQVSQPSSFTRAVSSETLSVGA